MESHPSLAGKQTISLRVSRFGVGLPPQTVSPQLRDAGAQHRSGFGPICCSGPARSPCCRRSVVSAGLLLCLHLCPASCCPDLHRPTSKRHTRAFHPRASAAGTAAPPSTYWRTGFPPQQRSKGGKKKRWLKAINAARKLHHEAQAAALQD